MVLILTVKLASGWLFMWAAMPAWHVDSVHQFHACLSVGYAPIRKERCCPSAWFRAILYQLADLCIACANMAPPTLHYMSLGPA